MAGPVWVNTYNLTEEQITSIDLAEEAMDMLDLTKAEKILNKLKQDDPFCIPVLNILGHLHGRYLSDYEAAIDYYDQVLKLEPENAWARDERRKFRRFQTY
tara:strand:+ start:9340 stop:9642 length:303 start_codon:yes stop_codon:yes gene_type:complete